MVEVLVGKNLTLQQGYEAFDADKDGKVSLQDLQTSVANMNLNIDEFMVQALYSLLDPDKLGYILKERWSECLGIQYSRSLKPLDMSLEEFDTPKESSIFSFSFK